MNSKAIQTNMSVVGCDVCGRTLLRGEHADVFLHGGERRMVCELCTTRAMHEGWIREGVDTGGLRAAGERRGARSLLGRLGRRRGRDQVGDSEAGRTRSHEHAAPAGEPEDVVYNSASWDPEQYDPAAAPVAASAPLSNSVWPEPEPAEPAVDAPRRDVHAVPTNSERKIARALEVFNNSPHKRTVAGVARSLGAPSVAAHPSATEGSIVAITVAWELSWYRYEVDLGDEAAGVRVVAQGDELSELEPVERSANATADDKGELHAGVAHQ